jgi:hypothetical protein
MTLIRFGLIVLFFLSFFWGCKEETCEEYRAWRRQTEFYIVVKKFSNNGRKYWISGLDRNGLSHSIDGAATDISRAVDIMQVNDTFVKDTGTLRFYIRRRGRVISRAFWCGDTLRYPLDSIKSL